MSFCFVICSLVASTVGRSGGGGGGGGGGGVGGGGYGGGVAAAAADALVLSLDLTRSTEADRLQVHAYVRQRQAETDYGYKTSFMKLHRSAFIQTTVMQRSAPFLCIS